MTHVRGVSFGIFLKMSLVRFVKKLKNTNKLPNCDIVGKQLIFKLKNE